MRYLIPSHTLPAYAPNVVARWLESRGHEVHRIVQPDRYHRVFVPFGSHALNIVGVLKRMRGVYDVAFTVDPSIAAALLPLRRLGRIKRLVYWCIDYYPAKYPGPLQRLYEIVERRARHADEVWNIFPPHGLFADSKARVVPYLLDPGAIVEGEERTNRVVWSGPDRDESFGLAKQGMDMLDAVEFARTSYDPNGIYLSEDAYHAYLARSKVGLAIYRPSPTSSKQYCDPGRIKAYLAAGLPVVTTRVAPVWRELEARGAGRSCDYTAAGIANAVTYCLDHFDRMSGAAYTMAREHVASERWLGTLERC